jgi:tetratricopeptide (TPR) repeat protein
MRHLGMRTRAIAWLRMGIEDPAKLSETDELLASRLAEFLGPEEAEAWRQYLVDPVRLSDPTADYVAAEFGSLPPQPLNLIVEGSARRRLWLAKLYRKERRTDEARALCEQALLDAATPAEKGELLTLLADCRRTQRDDAYLETAHQAVEQWLEAIRTAERPGDAHYAIHMAAGTYARVGCPKHAVGVLERLRDAYPPDEAPDRAAVIRFRLMIEYKHNDRYEDAKAEAREFLTLFLDRPFGPGHETLCTYTFLHLAYTHARQGDLPAAFDFLDQAEDRFSNQYGEYIRFCREHITERFGQDGGDSR